MQLDAKMLRLETTRLVLATPDTDSAADALAFHQRNLAHLAKWSPPIPPTADSLEHWRVVALHAQNSLTAGTLIRFWVYPSDAPRLMIASIGFSQIHRGPFCHAVLGYQIDAQFEGKGLMHEALQRAINYMFTEQRLHRISANYRPENKRSGRLLARLGFRVEGYAERYLFIDGAWRDHILTALTNDAFQPAWLNPPPTA